MKRPPEPIRSPGAATREPLRILLVHRLPFPELARWLAREGHEVLVVGDRERPVRYLRPFEPQLIVIAAGNASAICGLLRDAAPDTPILALAPGREAEDRISALDAGADDCLATPFQNAELRVRMRAACRRRASIGSLADRAPEDRPAGVT